MKQWIDSVCNESVFFSIMKILIWLLFNGMHFSKGSVLFFPMKWMLKGETVCLFVAGERIKNASGGIVSAGSFYCLALVVFLRTRVTMKHSCIELHARKKCVATKKKTTNRPFNLNCSTHNIIQKNFFLLLLLLLTNNELL